MNDRKWTEQELKSEFDVTFETRLGIMCGLDEPTVEQLCCAIAEADETVEKLKCVG